MASFSTKSNPFLIDSIFSPHKISGFVEEIENLNFNWVYSDDNEPSGSVFKEQNSTGEFTAVGDIVALTSKKRRAENGVKVIFLFLFFKKSMNLGLIFHYYYYYFDH